MARIPAYCPHCGVLFPSLVELGGGGGGGGAVLVGNKETCINCGQMADILDGMFNAVGDVLELISGPQFTRDILQALAELLEKAKQNQITVDELERAATEIDPELGAAVAAIKKTKSLQVGVFILLLFALRQCDFNFDAKVDINELWDQFQRPAIEQPAD